VDFQAIVLPFGIVKIACSKKNKTVTNKLVNRTKKQQRKKVNVWP